MPGFFVAPTHWLLMARFNNSVESRTRALIKLDAELASVDRSHGG